MSVNTLATYGPLATCRIAWRAVRLAAPGCETCFVPSFRRAHPMMTRVLRRLAPTCFGAL